MNTDRRNAQQGKLYITQALESGYREMAEDKQRECEAEEWCEGLVTYAFQENE